MKRWRHALLASVAGVALWGAVLDAQQGLSQREHDFSFIVAKEAERLGLPFHTTPEKWIAYAKSLCDDIAPQGCQAVVDSNRQRAAALPGDETLTRRRAAMLLRHAVATSCSPSTQQAYDALVAARPTPPAPPAAPQSEGTLYERFMQLARASNIDLQRYPSYTEAYVKERARFFCELMQVGEMMKLTIAIAAPPVQGKESPKERPRLETAILMTGTDTYCPQHQAVVEQFRRTNER